MQALYAYQQEYNEMLSRIMQNTRTYSNAWDVWLRFSSKKMVVLAAAAAASAT